MTLWNVTRSNLRSRDPFGAPFVSAHVQPEVAQYRPNGDFWPEVTLWNVTRSEQRSPDPFGVPLDVRMRNRKLRNIGPSGAIAPKKPIGVLSRTSESYK